MLRETERLQKGRIRAAPRWHQQFVRTTRCRFTTVTPRLIVDDMASVVQLKVAALQQLLFEFLPLPLHPRFRACSARAKSPFQPPRFPPPETPPPPLAHLLFSP